MGLFQSCSCRCRWPFLPRYFPVSLRTRMLWARSSSAARRTATPCCRACLHPHRVATGTTASPSSRRTGSFSLPAKPKLSNVIGLLPSRGLSIGQWGRRNMQVWQKNIYIYFSFFLGLSLLEFDCKFNSVNIVILAIFVEICLYGRVP